jgi:hypothetical protein
MSSDLLGRVRRRGLAGALRAVGCILSGPADEVKAYRSRAVDGRTSYAGV